MHKKKLKKICMQCGEHGNGDFCSHCGQSMAVDRLTVHSILHEVFHFFTHLDKGFLYTLKMLFTKPGRMQKDYIDGHRSRYQKPFSMFFICGSITAFALYLIHKPSGEPSRFEEVQADFTRHYYVLLQSILLPLYAFITWLLFKNHRINYAESLVMFAYTLSCMLLLVILTNITDLLWENHISSAWYEVSILLGYLLWTNLNFFKTEKKWVLVIKTALNLLAGYFISQFTADLLVKWQL